MFKKLIAWLGKNRKGQPQNPSTVSLDSIATKRPEEIHFHWHFNDMAQSPTLVAWNILPTSMFESVTSVAAVDLAKPIYDEHLLDRARTQWQFGDWKSLAALSREEIEGHPERAKLALLAAAGRLQTGQETETRQFIRLAQDWGVSKKLISQILVAGVHNSLGCASTICNQDRRALEHFDASISTGTHGSVNWLVVDARIRHQNQLIEHRFLESSQRINTPIKLVAEQKARLILVAGLNRSGSTWLYNCVRLLLQSKYDVYACWVKDYDPSNPKGVHVVKLHAPDDKLNLHTDEIYTSRRDIREIAGSMMRMGWLSHDKVQEYLDWLTSFVHPFWFNCSRMEIDYSEIKSGKRLLVEKIGHSLGIHLDAKQAQMICIQLEALHPGTSFDAITQLHPNHISSRIMEDYTELLGKKLMNEIAVRYRDWLVRFDYISEAGL